MIDYTLAIQLAEKRQSLCKNKETSNFIREFAFDKCHYLTKVLADHLLSKDVTLFYLSNTQQIIHSAIPVEAGAVLDAQGIARTKEIEAYYDASNHAMGQFEALGPCLSEQIPAATFDPDSFYHTSFDVIKAELLDRAKRHFFLLGIDLKNY